MSDNMPIEGLRNAATPRQAARPQQREETSARPDIRADSVREAEEYARRVIDQLGDRGYDFDEFHIDRALWPPGWSYEWKAMNVLGKANSYHIQELQRTGWRAVQASRHPDMMPAGHEGAIEKKGQILMERPTILSDRAERERLREARDALRDAEAALHEAPPNTGPRDDPSPAAQAINRVKRDFVTPREAAKQEG